MIDLLQMISVTLIIYSMLRNSKRSVMCFFCICCPDAKFFDQKEKMSLALVHKIPTRAIETLFDEQNQPLFTWADFGRYLIRNIRGNFRDLDRYYIATKDIGGWGGGKGK